MFPHERSYQTFRKQKIVFFIFLKTKCDIRHLVKLWQNSFVLLDGLYYIHDSTMSGKRKVGAEEDGIVPGNAKNKAKKGKAVWYFQSFKYFSIFLFVILYIHHEIIQLNKPHFSGCGGSISSFASFCCGMCCCDEEQLYHGFLLFCSLFVIISQATILNVYIIAFFRGYRHQVKGYKLEIFGQRNIIFQYDLNMK